MKRMKKWLVTLCAAVLLLAAMVTPVSAGLAEELNIPEEARLLTIGETVDHFLASFTSVGEEPVCSDPSVLYVSKTGQVTGKGYGVAEVLISTKTEVYAVVTPEQKEIILEERENGVWERLESANPALSMASFFFLIPLAFIGFAVYLIVTMVLLSKKSMGRRHLPPRQETGRTIKEGAAEPTHCPKCGKPFEDAKFCSACGTAKEAKNQYIIPIEGSVSAQELEGIVNRWFAENPYVYDCSIRLDTRQSLWNPFVRSKFRVKSAVIEYSVADQPQKYQYGLAFLYKLRVFGPIGYSSEKQVAKWLEQNPGCQVIQTRGGHIQHWDSNGGIYAQYYNYVLFKK